MKLVNPLLYPLAVLAGGTTLVIGVRLARLPSVVMLPTSILVATASAGWLKSREPETLHLDNSQLAKELQAAYDSAKFLAQQATSLRLEAIKLLTDSSQLELLAIVQYACDRAVELPSKIDQLSRRLGGSDSLLSVSDLQEQLTQVQNKLQSSSGIATEHLNQLATSLQRNIKLAQQGQDARQAQVVSLSTFIQDTAGVLQELQNKLRGANLNDPSVTLELRSLSEQFNSFQENVDLLVSK